MKFKLELIIVIIIISIITILEVFTSKNTSKVLEEITLNIDKMKIQVKENNFNIDIVNIIEDYWFNKNKTLSLYIEHDELEKVGNAIFRLKENVSNKNKENALENMEEIKFLLNHINGKGILNMQNIF